MVLLFVNPGRSQTGSPLLMSPRRKTGLADIAALFHEAGSPEAALQRQYWAWDKVHLGPAGHTLVAQAVLAAITSGD